jgi:hypothetical protein
MSTESTAEPGRLRSLVRDGLAGRGLDVGQGEDRLLVIAWPGARCELSVGDCGQAEWEYSPWPPATASPGLLADLATTLLTGRPGPFPRLAAEGTTLKGTVGHELRARGLKVELAVYAAAALDAFAEIVATSPGAEGSAQVHVADDGDLTWIRDYEAAITTMSGPGEHGQAGPVGVADAVAETVARAMACLRDSHPPKSLPAPARAST